MQKTQGICLNFVRFKESSIIVQVFTEQFGRQSYIVNGVRSKSAKNNKIALYQPLTQLEMVVWHKENREIQRITEVKLSYSYYNLTVNPRKTIVAIFLTEILSKILKVQEEDPSLYSYITSALQAYDQLSSQYENFHLQFLLKLPNFFGLGLDSANQLVENQNDLKFTDNIIANLTNQLIESSFQNNIKLNLSNRREILQLIIRFYQHHFENFGELKSWEVLKSIQ